MAISLDLQIFIKRNHETIQTKVGDQRKELGNFSYLLLYTAFSPLSKYYSKIKTESTNLPYFRRKWQFLNYPPKKENHPRFFGSSSTITAFILSCSTNLHAACSNARPAMVGGLFSTKG